jgi:CcmD family protein
MGDLWYLALAYGIIWLGLFAYLVLLAGRSESLRRELGLLRQMLQVDSLAETEEPDEAMASAMIGSDGPGGDS